MDDWKCPKCGAPCNDHGKGECQQPGGGACSGMICECDGDTEDTHGTEKEICPDARCYHCGWEGQFPTGMVTCPTCHGAGKIKAKKAKKGE